MKRIIYVLVLIVCSLPAFSQSTFEKGTNVGGIGIGFGTTFYGNGYNTTLPPISLFYERSVADKLIDGNASVGVGALIGIAGSKYSIANIYGSYTYKYSNFLIGARGALHYQFVDKLDTYFGLLLGGNISSYSYEGTGIYANESGGSGPGGFLFSAYVGTRYYFNDKIGAYLEFGTGIAYFNLGVVAKF